MRIAVLASLTGHAAAIAALATMDWHAPEFPPSIPVAVLVPPALSDRMASPMTSSAAGAPPPAAAPAAAGGAPGLDLSAALREPVTLPPPAPVSAPARKPMRQAKPAPAVETTPEASNGAADPQASSSDLASLVPATAPIVEVGPALLPGNPRPEYPPAARRRALEGRTVVRAVVAVDGRVASVELRHSSSHELLDRAALDAVRRWRFAPAKRGEQAVDGAVDVPVVFRLED